MSDTLIYRGLIALIGITVGYLGAGLLYEIAPSLVAFRNGVDPLVQGAVVGGTLALLLGMLAILVTVDQ